LINYLYIIKKIAQYIKNLRSSISPLDYKILKEEYIELKIIQWSRINKYYISRQFDLCGHEW